MTRTHRPLLLGGAAAAALLAAAPAFAQTEPSPQSSPVETATEVQEVVVVGSHIEGARTTEALPVVVLDAAQIDATGAISGDELMRSIPQMGDVLFDASNNPQTSNAARGDVNSVNLRSLGVGNTLVLLNGRRLVQHPTSQGTSDTGTVPVQSFNSNAIPVSGLARMEVLLDGAAAIYGADAVAGVVNTVLKDNFDGLTMTARYGGAEGTSMREFDGTVFAGKRFDRGNVSLFLNYTDRTKLWAADQDFTVSDDMRPLFAGYPDFAGLTSLDGRSSHTPWARTSVGRRSVIRQNGVALTNSAGSFHVQPESYGCPIAFGTDTCLASGNTNFNTTHRDLRYDTRYGTTVRPSVKRLNIYLTGHYEITPTLTAFGEVGYYGADSRAVQPPVVNLNSLWIPASNYWNPVGPVTFAGGAVNPNRLPNLTNVPAEGLPVELSNYRYIDTGFQEVRVKNYQSRFVGGLRGELGAFDWEGALTYSEAEATDTSPNIDRTALQANLALSTPDAYNPFNGGCVDTTSHSDCTPSSQAAIDAIVFDLKRVSRTTLTMADFKITRPDLFELPAGPVGVAFGVEARRETQKDDRDANLDGTITFTDVVSGETDISNVAAVSPNPDTSGRRTVGSAYIEFAVPLVSPEMGIPLVQRVDVQLAGRYENYSDFGSVAKPKVAVAWDVISGLRLRGSYSEGFRAPNLEQTHATQYARAASGTDYIRCEADIRAGRISSMAECSQGTSGLSLLVAGNPDLEPEESTNWSYGLVFQPQFVPPAFGDLTLTIDHWQIQQEKIVGLLGAETALAVDYLERLQGGSNPLVERAAPTPDDEDLFDGTGLASVGEAISVSDRFINLQPQTVSGVDIGLEWSLRHTPVGNFRVRVNASQLLEFTRDPGPIVDSLYAARAAGILAEDTPLPNSSQLIAQDGRPEWRVSTTITWTNGPWRAGLSTQYRTSVDQTDLIGLSGNPWEIDARLVANLYGQYRFDNDTRVRLGVRDLTNEGPALAENGYKGSLDNPWGRYWYFEVSKTF